MGLVVGPLCYWESIVGYMLQQKMFCWLSAAPTKVCSRVPSLVVVVGQWSMVNGQKFKQILFFGFR